MPRIRSVHPGLFTDEAFVSLSSDAQVFLIGLWTDADDQGVFEWKPLTLKMRLRAAKDGPTEPLLAELVAIDCIKKYEMNGKEYGAIRNFRKYQRPKSPNTVHPITDNIRIYVSLTKSISEIVEDDEPPFPPNGEKSPQMEEVGGREGGRREKKEPRASALAGIEDDFSGWYEVYPRHEARGQAMKAYRSARKKLSKNELLEAVGRARERYRGTDPKFIPLPASWLNGERWADQNNPHQLSETAEDRLYRTLVK